MLKVVRSLKYYLRKNGSFCTPLLYKTVFFGGLFLALLLALCPQDTYAYDLGGFPSDDSSVTGGVFSMNYMRGCLSTNYYLTNGSTFKGGDNFDNHAYSCGYRYSNGHLSYWGQSELSSKKYRTVGSDGSVIQNESVPSAGDYYSTADRQISTVLKSIDFKVCQQSGNIIGCNTVFPLIPDSSNIRSSYALVVFKFNKNKDLIPTNGIPIPSGDIRVFNKNGVDISQNDVSTMNWSELVRSNINNSTIFKCGLPNSSYRGKFPEAIDISSFNANSCVLAFTVPLDTDYYVSFLDGFSFTTPNPNYNLYYYPRGGLDNYLHIDPVPVPTLAFTGLLGNDVNIIHDGFYSSDESIQILIPTNEDEYNNMWNYEGFLSDSHSNQVSFPDSSDSSSNIFQAWFDVFLFPFTFPLRGLISSFNTNDTCVDIPIIGGMLNNPNARYCSWFSSEIRSTLTPAFNFFSIMLITGFIFSFLKGHSDPIAFSSTDNYQGTWSWGKDKGKL